LQQRRALLARRGRRAEGDRSRGGRDAGGGALREVLPRVLEGGRARARQPELPQRPRRRAPLQPEARSRPREGAVQEGRRARRGGAGAQGPRARRAEALRDRAARLAQQLEEAREGMNLPLRMVEGRTSERLLSVDGAWGQPGLNLSHWPGNATPKELK